MPVYISEIVTESIPPASAEAGPAPGAELAGGRLGDADADLIVRRAVERVLEVLRREWDR